MSIKKNAVLNFPGGEAVTSEIHTYPATIELIVELGSDDPDGTFTHTVTVKTPEGWSALESVDPETGDVIIAYEGGAPK